MIPDDDQLVVTIGKIHFPTDLGTCDVVVEANEDTELHFTLKNDKDNIQIKAFVPEYKKTTRYLNMEEKKELMKYMNDTISNSSADMLEINRKNWVSIIGSLNLVSYGDFPQQNKVHEQSMPNYLELEEK